MTSVAHIPVLRREVAAWLAARPNGRYIDATVGLGGHAADILDASAPAGMLMAMDADAHALLLAKEKLQAYGDRVTWVHGRHAELAQRAQQAGFWPVDGVLFDLGVSSMQLDDAARGFSFRDEGPLDMRMDDRAGTTAADIVNTWPEAELARILWEYGEERFARRVARQICAARPLRTTVELSSVVERAVRTREKIHPATRTFQALRIAVNDELASLAGALPQAVAALAPGGRLVVIAFHSLEDRIVKQFIVRESRDCVCPPGQPACTCGHRATLRALTRKPVRPTEEEERENPRSRSARLRAAERLPGQGDSA